MLRQRLVSSTANQERSDLTIHIALSNFGSSICLNPQTTFADDYKRRRLSFRGFNKRCWATLHIYAFKLIVASQLSLSCAHLSQKSWVHQEILFELYCFPTSPFGIRPSFRARVATFGMHDFTQSNSMPANNGSLVHDVQE